MQSSISLITVNFNNAQGLVNTIQSVMAQSCSITEFIIIDGGSTDESIPVIKKYHAHISYWESEKDNGIYDAMNKGIKKAKGDFVMFMNSGDTFADNSVLSLCNKEISSFSEIDIFYGDIWGSSQTKQNKWLHKHPEQLSLGFFENQNINHQAALIRRNLFSNLGLYPDQYKLAGDHWFFLKCLINDRKFKHINAPLVNYNYDGASSSKRHLYELEMQAMWMDEVPMYAQRLLSESKKLQFELNTRFIRNARRLKHFLKHFKTLPKQEQWP